MNIPVTPSIDAPLKETEPFETNVNEGLAEEELGTLDFLVGMEFEVPSEEEMRAERQARYDWTAQNTIREEHIPGRTVSSDPARLNCLSLPAWLEIARAAAIPFIPARPLASFDAEAFYDTFDHHDIDNGYNEFHATIVNDLDDDEMVRMEQVAPREVKSVMSEGSAMTSGLFELADGSGLYLDLHEDRFYTTFGDLGATQVRAFARPIVEPRMIAGSWNDQPGEWPAEFRVFIEGSKIVGISNYYPQVAMDPDHYGGAVRETLRMAQKMLDAMDAMRLGVGNHSCAPDLNTFTDPQGVIKRVRASAGWRPDHWGEQDFTLDFMQLKGGSMIFLEGGPAGMKAAHPCCFLQEGRPVDDNFLRGVAFSTTEPVHDLPDRA
jgi:hypothetical protein